MVCRSRGIDARRCRGFVALGLILNRVIPAFRIEQFFPHVHPARHIRRGARPPWLVEAVDDSEPDLTTLKLSCIADDAQGEQIEVIWDAEISPRILDEDPWASLGRGAPDSPEVLA